jgi:hypothetical protein
MIRSRVLSAVLALVCAVGLVALSGCESEPSDRNVGGYFDQNPYSSQAREPTSPAALEMTPSIASLANNGDRQLFEVDGGQAPYSWGVQDISRGSVVTVGSASAVYQRSWAGGNVVICTDSRGTRVMSTITQPW